MRRWAISSLCVRHIVYLHKPIQYSIAYYTPSLYGVAYCSYATNLYSMLLYWILLSTVTRWYYNIILWDHRNICGPSLIETAHTLYIASNCRVTAELAVNWLYIFFWFCRIYASCLHNFATQSYKSGSLKVIYANSKWKCVSCLEKPYFAAAAIIRMGYLFYTVGRNSRKQELW
jgi:hypothetical protein